MGRNKLDRASPCFGAHCRRIVQKGDRISFEQVMGQIEADPDYQNMITEELDYGSN